jgi:hypothetical protein
MLDVLVDENSALDESRIIFNSRVEKMEYNGHLLSRSRLRIADHFEPNRLLVPFLLLDF